MSQKNSESFIPQSIEAEEGVLGSILLDPEAYVRVSDFLHAEDFYRALHRTVYEVMASIVERQETPDIISVNDELRSRSGEDHWLQLNTWLEHVPTSGNVEMYGRMVEGKAVSRRLMAAAGNIAASAMHDEPEEALLQAEETIFAISQKRNVTTFSPIAEVMSRCMSKMDLVSEQRAAGKKTMMGIPTGYRDLDRLLKGLRKKALYILSARPAIGKTSLALNIAYKVACKGYRVGFFSLEMGDEELGFRMISMESQVNSNDLQTGEVEGDDWERVIAVMETISQSRMLIDETGGLSIAQVRSRARHMRSAGGLDLIIVDYLQLLNAKKDGRPIENRTQEVSEISRQLKLLSKELDVPVLALAQLSRSVEMRQCKVPQLSDLRESGGIENDADCVMFIYRDEVYNPQTERPRQADIIVAKHRNGDTGEVVLHWEPTFTKFYDIDHTLEK